METNVPNILYMEWSPASPRRDTRHQKIAPLTLLLILKWRSLAQRTHTCHLPGARPAPPSSPPPPPPPRPSKADPLAAACFRSSPGRRSPPPRGRPGPPPRTPPRAPRHAGPPDPSPPGCGGEAPATREGK